MSTLYLYLTVLEVMNDRGDIFPHERTMCAMEFIHLFKKYRKVDVSKHAKLLLLVLESYCQHENVADEGNTWISV